MGRSRWRAWGGLAACAVVAGVASALEPRSDAGALLSILVQFVLDAFATWSLLGAARRSAGRMRQAWGFLAIGPFLAMVVILAAIAEVTLRGTSTLGPAIIPPLLAVNTLAVVAGLVLLSPPQVRGGTAVRFGLDAIITSLSVFFLFWAGLDVRQNALTEAPAEAVLVALYPATDAAAATIVLLVLGLAHWRVPRWYGFLAASAAIVLVGDVLAAAFEVAGHPWVAATFGDTGFLLSLVLMALAARGARPWPDGVRDERFAAQWMPYLPFGLAVLAALYDYLENDGLALDLFAIVLLMVAAVVARTILLLRENRRLAQGLKATSEFKTQLLRFISHEIANPLSPLKLQANLLDDGKRPSSWAIVRRSIGRLESLSRDVRLMALAETRRLVQETKPTDLVPRLRAAAATYAAVGDGKGVHVALGDTPPELVVPLDGERFDQVVDNLLSNAVKFTPAGGQVHLHAASTAGGCEVRVTDTGPGLSAPQRAALFTAFGRVHGDSQPGLGLGLYLCKAIVEGHGGTIRVESDGVGKGCTFTVSLPGQTKAPPVPELGQAPHYPDDAVQ